MEENCLFQMGLIQRRRTTNSSQSKISLNSIPSLVISFSSFCSKSLPGNPKPKTPPFPAKSPNTHPHKTPTPKIKSTNSHPAKPSQAKPISKAAMKVRSVKLREAHKAASSSNGRGGGSFCSVVWDQQAHHLVTASSSDPSISIHDPLLPSSAPRILRHHRDGVTAIAISPNSTCLASGSIDHSVKLYKFPGILISVSLFLLLSMKFVEF